MKKLYTLKVTFMLFFSISICAALQAQNIQMIDVNKEKNSFPNNFSSIGTGFAELNGIFYFSADDGIHGSEVWYSDGTAGGTRLLKDISPGSGPSSPVEIIASGDKIYFSEFDGTRRGLYVSDGTRAGTKFLVDVGTSPNTTTNVNGMVYFIVNHNFSEYQLWKTDGTEAGTVMVADLYAKFSATYVENLKNVNGKLFFTLNNEIYGGELYMSDGTDAGTAMVADINPGSNGSFPARLTALNGLLYFSADDGSGLQLWVSDGTAGGTHLVNNSNGIYVSQNGPPFAVRNNTLFFRGNTAAAGDELNKYNSSDTSRNIKLVKDIIPGSTGSYPSYITEANGTVFFVANNETSGAGLWKTDGSSEGTILVKANTDGAYYDLTNVNGTLFFTFYNFQSGASLWKSDGTPGGTQFVKNIAPELPPTPGDGFILFAANDGKKGSELWRSDGTEEGTVMVKDINRTVSASSDPSGFTATTGNKVVFQATTPKYGTELWVTDGTEEGTRLLKDIIPGPDASLPTGPFIHFKQETYFFPYAIDSGFYLHLAKTNGTKAGTSLITSLKLDNAYIEQTTVANNLFYFSLINYNTFQRELWRSDGTAAGTYALKTDMPYYFSFNLAAVGKTLFFTNSDDVNGNELWKSDGTIAGTALLKDIYPGPDGSFPYSLYNYKNKLYFSANYGYGSFLWTSDGTETGTVVVKPILVGSGFAEANGKLFFYGYNTVAKGSELFVSDGTGDGTKLVKDINHGPAGSAIYTLVSGDSLIYLTADDGKHGWELWRSNGTKEGTHLLKDITPGIDPSYFTSLVSIHDRLFFILYDTLWQSDGTKQGTNKVDDPMLDGAYYINNLTAIGNRLYFTGNQYITGNEMYIAKINAGVVAAEIASKSISISPKADNAFEARLLTNPISDQLKLMVNIKTQQAVQVTIADASGRIIINEKQTLFPGTKMFSYDAKAWRHGLYIIRVVTADGSASSLKAIK